MAHVANKRVTLDEIWPELESGLLQLITNLNKGFPMQQWVKLYSYHFQNVYVLIVHVCVQLSVLFPLIFVQRSVYNYCTTSRPPTVQRGNSSVKTVSGANFVGEELYTRLCDFLRRHMRELLKVRNFYIIFQN